MNAIRTILFYFVFVIATFFWSIAIIVMRLLPEHLHHRYSIGWASTTIWLARILAGIRWQVHGAENLPKMPVVFMINHQSNWETIFMPTLHHKNKWVLKKSLLHIPFLGWALASLRPIAIDRSKRKEAMSRIIEQGTERVSRGYSVILYPEGTRQPPGVPIAFKQGAIRLAKALNLPIVAVAHNAGQFWPKRGWMRAGTVQVYVSPPFAIDSASPAELNARIEQWVQQHRDLAEAAENLRREQAE